MNEPAQTLEQLVAEFSRFAVDPGRLFLLDAWHAKRFILRGVQEGLVLQGVESFYITPEGAFQPEQEFSNDIAELSMTHAQFVDETIRLVEKGGGKELRFQVVFDASNR